jgi:hypothetical protein
LRFFANSGLANVVSASMPENERGFLPDSFIAAKTAKKGSLLEADDVEKK